jgi:hypothetical protein
VLTFVCAGCAKETSVTAGTITHRSHLPLSIWFYAAYPMATHSNGMSALQLQGELGLGSCKTAWLLAMKPRRAMVAPGRSPLAGLVEVDETTIPFRTKNDPPAGGQGMVSLVETRQAFRQPHRQASRRRSGRDQEREKKASRVSGGHDLRRSRTIAPGRRALS